MVKFYADGLFYIPFDVTVDISTPPGGWPGEPAVSNSPTNSELSEDEETVMHSGLAAGDLMRYCLEQVAELKPLMLILKQFLREGPQ